MFDEEVVHAASRLPSELSRLGQRECKLARRPEQLLRVNARRARVGMAISTPLPAHTRNRRSAPP
eukprot:1182417-Pleurochrysis_carterae.AAC.1